MDNNNFSLSILGSTGSIGCQSLMVIDKMLASGKKIKIKSLCGGSNFIELSKQAIKYQPEYIVINDKTKFEDLQQCLQNKYSGQILAGFNNILEVTKEKVDCTIVAITGIIGLEPMINAVKNSKRLAIANKESLICAGPYILELAAQSKCLILPIDSEHNAIFQIFAEKHREFFDKIILTGSGGPFFKQTRDELKHITPAQAIKHPNWQMGKKISIDSATMANKALELVECLHLFKVQAQQVEINIHPQSIIHSMVLYKDGSCLAQLGDQNMQIPISYCLNYPQRFNLNLDKFDLTKLNDLTFYPEDNGKFPTLRIMRQAISFCPLLGPLSFNIANEFAVNAFLNKEISFLSISDFIEKIIAKTFKRYSPLNNYSFATIQEIINEVSLLVKSELKIFIN